MAATLTNPAGQHRFDDRFVLAQRPLLAGYRLEQTNRFRDDVWQLGPANLQAHTRSVVVNLALIPDPWRVVAKELLFAMLSGDLPPGEERPTISTVRTRYTELKRFMIWLDTGAAASTGRRPASLRELVGADLQSYQKHLIVTLKSPDYRDIARGGVRMLWRYRSALSDHLTFDPANLDGWCENNRRRGENSTNRIPEQVHGPFMVWAMRFVDDFSADIIAAADKWRILRSQAAPTTPARRGAVRDPLRQLLADHIAKGQPLPGYRGKPNILALSRLIGGSQRAVRYWLDEIEAAATVVGVDNYTRIDIPITARIDDQPWIEAIATDVTGYKAAPNLAKLVNLLLAAAYAAIAFQSGMRDCEIKHLRRNCLSVQRDATGRIYRYKVTSLAFKGETDPNGVRATWIVGAPAARAIGVLEQLQPAGTDYLFAATEFIGGSGSVSRIKNPENHALLTVTTNDHLNCFVTWINEYCTTHQRNDFIPTVNGTSWRITTRQWRRTLAWFIARRPGGSIAGAIAFRHLSIQMFEGYAGTSDSGFRAEVESEQALARGEHLLAMIDQHEHTNLAGPAAEEAAQRLEGFADRTHFQGKVITDEHRLRRLMTRDDPAVYPGKYVTCVHTHATALCQQRRDHGNKLRPDIATCKPLACRNVALTRDNIVNLRLEITRIADELDTRPLLPPLLRHQLQARRDDIKAFLDRHTPEST
ncbi:hypothetical protein ACIA8C_42885 [Nocardia sp. NPDC051321]|uniref:hypothetical protein n=1 Tax=Nocardia sp. NPDC051321 TaxID=3364323 RepID=UPI0037977E49